MSCKIRIIVFTHTKGRCKGRGTVAIVQACPEEVTHNSEDVKKNIEIGHVVGKFRKGKRNGFCTVATEDLELKGFFDEHDLLNGYGTIHYKSEGSWFWPKNGSLNCNLGFFSMSINNFFWYIHR